ncbi:hypothetical protein TMatcc_002726 [Talaromyces marneffei ATCC 18224]
MAGGPTGRLPYLKAPPATTGTGTWGLGQPSGSVNGGFGREKHALQVLEILRRKNPPIMCNLGINLQLTIRVATATVFDLSADQCIRPSKESVRRSI